MCNSAVLNEHPQPHVTCDEYKSTFHSKHAGLDATYSNSIVRITKWKCQNGAMNDSDDGGIQSSIKALINMVSQMNKKLDNVATEQCEIKASQYFLAENHNDFVSRMQAYEEVNKNLRLRCEMAALTKKKSRRECGT